MFDIGIGEVFVLLVVALLVFGPDRLPEMARQAASFVRDLRAMVANARRDLSGSVGDLGIDKDDLQTLADLRNPKSFVRQKVLDGVDLDLGLDDDDEIPPARRNGASARNGTRKPGTNGTPRTTPASTSDGAAQDGADGAAQDGTDVTPPPPPVETSPEAPSPEAPAADTPATAATAAPEAPSGDATGGEDAPSGPGAAAPAGRPAASAEAAAPRFDPDTT